METKKNTPETKIQIHSQERIKIIMQYPGHKFIWPGQKSNDVPDRITGYCNNRGWRIIGQVGTYYSLKDCTVLVKPLGKISDEDALTLAKMWYPGDTTIKEDYWHTAEKGREVALNWEKEAYYDGGYTGPDHLRLSDFLRSRGYALPYGEYSVEQLVEAGIYKLIDK